MIAGGGSPSATTVIATITWSVSARRNRRANIAKAAKRLFAELGSRGYLRLSLWRDQRRAAPGCGGGWPCRRLRPALGALGHMTDRLALPRSINEAYVIWSVFGWWPIPCRCLSVGDHPGGPFLRNAAQNLAQSRLHGRRDGRGSGRSQLLCQERRTGPDRPRHRAALCRRPCRPGGRGSTAPCAPKMGDGTGSAPSSSSPTKPPSRAWPSTHCRGLQIAGAVLRFSTRGIEDLEISSSRSWSSAARSLLLISGAAHDVGRPFFGIGNQRAGQIDGVGRGPDCAGAGAAGTQVADRRGGR